MATNTTLLLSLRKVLDCALDSHLPPQQLELQKPFLEPICDSLRFLEKLNDDYLGSVFEKPEIQVACTTITEIMYDSMRTATSFATDRSHNKNITVQPEFQELCDECMLLVKRSLITIMRSLTDPSGSNVRGSLPQTMSAELQTVLKRIIIDIPPSLLTTENVEALSDKVDQEWVEIVHKRISFRIPNNILNQIVEGEGLRRYLRTLYSKLKGEEDHYGISHVQTLDVADLTFRWFVTFKQLEQALNICERFGTVVENTRNLSPSLLLTWDIHRAYIYVMLGDFEKAMPFLTILLSRDYGWEEGDQDMVYLQISRIMDKFIEAGPPSACCPFSFHWLRLTENRYGQTSPEIIRELEATEKLLISVGRNAEAREIHEVREQRISRNK